MAEITAEGTNLLKKTKETNIRRDISDHVFKKKTEITFSFIRSFDLSMMGSFLRECDPISFCYEQFEEKDSSNILTDFKGIS